MNIYRRKIFLLAVFIPAALVALTRVPVVYAEDIPASDVQVSTPVYQPSEKFTNSIPLGTYTYEVSWEGIPAAQATISIDKEPGMFRVNATARTYSGIDVFYRLRYQADGLLSDKKLTPIRTVLNKKENRRVRLVAMSYLDTGEILTVREKRDIGKEEPPEVTSFRPNNFMLEPFSAALLARSLEWEPGVTREFDTFNGKSRYLITLKCVEKTIITFNEQPREVFVVVPSVKNLTSPNSNGKLRQARIYVSADDKQEILKIVSDVFIGAVTTKMESFTPQGVQVASKDHARKVVF